MLTWVEKYRPQKLRDIAGNPRAIKDLVKWAESWKKGIPTKKAILLHGPPGTGKTTTAYALARELGYDYIELNASDSRTKDIVDRIIGNASKLGTLNPNLVKKVLIIDEVDGIHGKEEYGGLAALKKWIKTSLQPIILIANDPWALPKEFRNLCEMVAFKRIDQRTVLKVLKKICSREGITADERALKLIATNSNGDLRSAINDLQSLSEGKKKISLDDTDILTIRDSELRIFETMARIFKATSCDRAKEALRESEEQPETVLMWVAENLPIEYEDPSDLARGYDSISKADIFLGRIERRQDWGLLKYAVDYMSAGVAMAKKRRYHKWSRYQYPKILTIYAETRKKREIMNSIAEKLQGKKDTYEKCHGSKKLMKSYLPIMRIIFNNNYEMAAQIASEFELNLEDISFFIEDNETAGKIYYRAKELTSERIKLKTRGEKQISLLEFG